MALQDLTYEINYSVDGSGLSKSLEMVNTFESSLSGIAEKINSMSNMGNIIEKINTPMNQVSKTLSNLNVDHLSNSIEKVTSNTKELNASTERQQRIAEIVNKYADDYNSKIDKSLSIAEQLNNRTAGMSSSVQEHIAAQQKLNQEIMGGVENEEKFANEANQASNNVGKAVTKANELKTSLSAVGKVSSGIGSMLGAFGFIGIGYGIASGIKEAITSYSDFQQEMARVHAVLGQVTSKDMTDLSNKAIQLSNAYAISSKEVSEGMEELASHGLNTKQILEAIQPSMLLATAGDIKMKDATLDISAALRNFNMEINNTNAAHIANVYAQAAADTAAAMPDMASALKNVAPIAGEVGISLENTAASIGLLADKGIKGGQAGTDLKIMIERLLSPVGKGADLISELGFKAIDPTTQKMKSMGTIVKDLSKAFESHGLTTAPEKNSALSIIFGREALPGVSALFGTAPKQIDDLTNSLKNSDNAAKNMVITVNDTLSKAFAKFKINIQNAFITNIEKSELGKSLKNFIAGINNNLPSITNNISWALNTTVRIGSFIKKNWDGILSIVAGVSGAFVTLKGAMAIKGALKTLSGLKKALPTIKEAGGIGLIATGFMEIHQGNTGLGDLLVATGIGFEASSRGLKALTSTSIGLVAEAFLEINQGNIGLGELLIQTAAGFQAINKKLNRAIVIEALGGAFIAIKEGNNGLGALLIGTAVGFAAIEIVTAPVAFAIGLIAAGIGYIVLQCATVKGAWEKTWLAIKGAAVDTINPVINLINDLISAIDKIPGMNIGKISTIQYNSNDVDMMKKLGYSSQTISQITGSDNKGTGIAQKHTVTTGTNALTNMVTNNSMYNLLPKTKYASGTNYSINGTALVGEKGPELVNLPGGSQIIPASRTSQILNSSYNQIGTGALNASQGLNNSTKKVIADNQKLITDYVNKHTLFGQDSIKNLSTATLATEPLSTNATTKVSTDNKNILNIMAQSGTTYGSGMINNLTQGVQANEDNLTNTVKTLTDKVIETFKSGFGIHSPSTVMYSMGTNLLQGLVNGMTSKDMSGFVQSWIGSMTSSAGGAVSGSLSGWITAAMALTGVPSDWFNPLASIIEHESGGDPNSINLYDINAIEGHPSKGLMQLIDENMTDYHLPGLTNIWDPVSNIAAGIKYILARYGSVFNVPGIRSMASGGSYVGYAEGTSNASPGVHLVGEKGPELLWFRGGEKVTPNNQLSTSIQRPYGSGSSNGITIQSSPVFQININGTGKNSQDIAAEVDSVLRKKFKSYLDETMATVKIQMGLS